MKVFTKWVGVLVSLLFGVQAFASQDAPSLIATMDSKLAECWNESNSRLDDSSAPAKDAKAWFKALGSEDRSSLLAVLMDRVEAASNEDQNAPFIKAAESYLLFAPSDDPLRGDILEMLGTIYADEQDKWFTTHAQNRLSLYAQETGQDYSEALKKLDLALASMRPLIDDLEGYWVSDWTNEFGYPQILVRIKNHKARLLESTKYYVAYPFIRAINAEEQSLNVAQQFDVNNTNDAYAFTFFTQMIKSHQFLASTMYGASQSVGRANAEYRAQNGVSFSDALGATIGTTFMQVILDGIGDELAKARSKTQILGFSGNRIQSGHLSATMEHRYITETMETERSESQSHSFNFYRIDPQEDHIVFAQAKDDVFLKNSATQEDLNELKKLNRKFWTAPLLGAGACLLVGGGLFAGSFALPKETMVRPDGKTYQAMSKGGYAMLVSGVIVALVGSSVTIVLLRDHSRKTGAGVYKSFNERQMNNLKKKYDVQVSASPHYDPFTNSAGAAFTINF